MISLNPKLKSHINRARAMMRSLSLVAVASCLMANDVLSQSEPECPIYRVTVEGKGLDGDVLEENTYKYKKTDCRKGYEGNWSLVKWTSFIRNIKRSSGYDKEEGEVKGCDMHIRYEERHHDKVEIENVKCILPYIPNQDIRCAFNGGFMLGLEGPIFFNGANIYLTDKGEPILEKAIGRIENDVIIIKMHSVNIVYELRGIIEELEADKKEAQKASADACSEDCLPEKKLPWPRPVYDITTTQKVKALLNSEEYRDRIVDDPAFHFYKLLVSVTSEARYDVSSDPKYGHVEASLYLPYTIALKGGRLYKHLNPAQPPKTDGFAAELAKTSFDESQGAAVSAALGETVATAIGTAQFYIGVAIILMDVKEANDLYRMSETERNRLAWERARFELISRLAEKIEGPTNTAWSTYFHKLYENGEIIDQHNQRLRIARSCAPPQGSPGWIRQD